MVESAEFGILVEAAVFLNSICITLNSQYVEVILNMRFAGELDTTKDLGLTIDSIFKPSTHCAQAFKEVRSAFSLIKIFFFTLTPDTFIPLYSTLVRPHLGYAIQASSPYLKKDVDHLERLQRLATRTVKGCGVYLTRSDFKS